MSLIGSVSAAAGWRAIFENDTSGKIESLPIAYWNQRKNSGGIVETIGVVMVPSHRGFVEVDTNDEELEKLRHIGYASPGESLIAWERSFEERWAKARELKALGAST